MNTKRAKIVLFGDSITQQSFRRNGWGACIADRYQKRADLINRGVSGWNTNNFLRYASSDDGKEDLFDHDNVKLVTIFFGANDACHAELNKHVPLEIYKSNIMEIVKLVKSNFGQNVTIILISPPPVCHEGRLKHQKNKYKDKATGVLERTLELSGQYAAAVKEVANVMGIPFLDLWTTMQFTSEGEGRRGWSDFLSDGLHLSAKGNMFVGKSLVTLIDEVVPDLC